MDPVQPSIAENTPPTPPPQGEQFPETPERRTSRLKSFVIVGATIVVIAVIAFMLTPIAGRILSEQGAKQITPTIVKQVLPTPTTDSTAEWKTYTNTKVGFSLKFPPRYPDPRIPSNSDVPESATGQEDDSTLLFGEDSTDYVNLQVFPYNGTLESLHTYDKTPSTSGISIMTLKKELQLGGQPAKWYETTPPTVYPESRIGKIRIFFTNNTHGFILETNLDQDEEEINQILSTFTFTEAPSEDGVACTMDAKECPDGSWVGRQGPNCEFAACPN